MAQKVGFQVTDMTCAGCAATVEKAVRGVTGVVQVDIDVEGKHVDVEFNPAQTNLVRIKEAVTESGYTIG